METGRHANSVDAQSSTTVPSTDPADYERIISIDYGTSKCKAAYRIVPRGVVGPFPLPHLLYLQDSSMAQIPQLVGFVWESGRWKFYWGEKLTALLRSRNKPSGQNIRLFDRLKMAFHGYHGADRIRDGIEKTLQEMGMQTPTVKWLMTENLRHVKAAFDEAIEQDIKDSTERFGAWTTVEVARMSERTRIGVPEVSLIQQNRDLQQMAKNAGFKSVQLLSEAESSLIYCAMKRRDQRRLFQPLEHDDEVLNIDGGGMSHNVACFRNSGFVQSGPDLELEFTGGRAGGTSGSEALGLKLIAEAKRHFSSTYPGGYDGMVKDLGRGPRGRECFESCLLKALDSYKKTFEDEEDGRVVVVQGDTLEKQVIFKITRYSRLDDTLVTI